MGKSLMLRKDNALNANMFRERFYEPSRLRSWGEKVKISKAEAVMQAIRWVDVGGEVIIHNEDGSVFCILIVKCKEHPE